MVERLLLDRIDAESGRPPVAGQLHARAVLARAPHEAQAPLPRPHLAEARADATLDPPIIELRPISDIDAISAHHSFAAFLRELLNFPICRERGGRRAIATRRLPSPGCPPVSFYRLIS